MNPIWLISLVVLWAAVLFVGFLLLGALRSLAILSWRLEQLEATTPTRIGRSGLKPGKQAPDFTLPAVAGGELTLHDFVGRQVLLVFTQSGCGPCQEIVPELNRVQSKGEHQVLVVNNGDPDTTREWAGTVQARFPIAIQERCNVSKRYEVFATPFAFLIDEDGAIASKGLVSNRQHLGYVLDGVRDAAKNGHRDAEVIEAV